MLGCQSFKRVVPGARSVETSAKVVGDASLGAQGWRDGGGGCYSGEAAARCQLGPFDRDHWSRPSHKPPACASKAAKAWGRGCANGMLVALQSG